MTPELRHQLRQLNLSLRAFSALTGVGEDVVSAWGTKAHPVFGVRQEPLWAKLLVSAWLDNPAALQRALVEAYASLSEDGKDQISPSGAETEVED
jgi:hypothetical protein